MNVSWMLAVKDRRAMNMALQWNGAHTTYELAKWLHQFGVTMKTLHTYTGYKLWPSPVTLLLSKDVPLGLGLRQNRDLFTLADYRQYVVWQNALLQRPWGRAALTKEGNV